MSKNTRRERAQAVNKRAEKSGRVVITLITASRKQERTVIYILKIFGAKSSLLSPKIPSKSSLVIINCIIQVNGEQFEFDALHNQL